MDLDTFLTTVYVLVDDWYKAEMAEQLRRHPGPTPKLSDSEVLTLAVASQWRVGVPWQSERGIVRYMQAQGQQWFPQMVGRSAFNERVRKLCLALVALQQYLETVLQPTGTVYQVGDGLPLPVCSLSQARREPRRWLADSCLGHGGTHGGWFIGQRWWVSVSPQGVICGWLVAAANLNERWLLEAMLSQRVGHGELHGPLPDEQISRQRWPLVPSGFIGGRFAVGRYSAAPYVVDRGLNGERWIQHWRAYYAAMVLAVPPDNSAEAAAWTRQDRHWLASIRQIVETVFAVLDQVLGIKRLQAHSQWGQYTRLAAKAAAFNLGVWLNQRLGRPALALATLLC